MVPFAMLVTSLLSRAVGAVGFAPLDGWEPAARVGLATMFVFTAVAHFNRMRRDLVRMVAN